MLPRKHRYSSALFERHFRRGKRIHTPHFLCIVSEKQVGHVAFTVSKKTAKHAVKRNRIRRQLYHMLANMADVQDLPVSLICLYKGAETLHNPAEISAEIRTILRRAGAERTFLSPSSL